MAYWHNLTNVTEATSIREYAIASDQLTGGMLSLGIIVATLLISYILMKSFESKSAIAASLFVTSAVTFLFVISGFSAEYYLLIAFLLLAASVVALYLEERY